MARHGSPFHQLLFSKMQKKRREREQTEFRPDPPVDVCSDNHITAYLNLPQVQQALGAKSTSWQECSSTVQYSHQDIMSSVIPVYEFLFKQNLSILVYSGDVDVNIQPPKFLPFSKRFKTLFSFEFFFKKRPLFHICQLFPGSTLSR